MGLTEKTVISGESLNDDLWHSVDFQRRGMIISLAIDDETPLVGKCYIVDNLSCTLAVLRTL